MEETSQTFIDNLILTISNAEESESVTNVMVAQVFDYLNTGYKDILSNSTGLSDEKAEREAADSRLKRYIEVLSDALQTVKNTAENAATTAQSNSDSISNINALLNGNATEAIDTLSEIIAFLDTFKNSDSLATNLQRLSDAIDSNVTSLTELENSVKDVNEHVEDLESAIKIVDIEDIDTIWARGYYHISQEIGDPIILIVNGSAVSGKNRRQNLIQYLFSTDGLQYRSGSKDITTLAPTWGEWSQVGQKGAGNLINVTELVPLTESGAAYELATAIKAVPQSYRSVGRWITFRTTSGEWETMQFNGSSTDMWEDVSSWDAIGGKGTITGIKLNNVEQTPDADGVINLAVDQISVDDSINDASTNPVQNKVIAQRIKAIEAKTVNNVVISVNDNNEVHVGFLNNSNEEFAGGDIPALSGGSSDTNTTAQVVLTASVDHTIIRDGDSVKLRYTYDHQYLGGDQNGESTGQRADIKLEIKNGTVTTYETTLSNVSRGTYELDITSYLRTGTTEINMQASVTNADTGKTQKRTAYCTVKSQTISLTSSYNLANSISAGGYKPSDSVTIPFTVTGDGEKTVTLYLDGEVYNSTVIKQSGKRNGSFVIPMTGLKVGRHNVQMVAELEATSGSETLTLVSESVYIDFLKTNELAQNAAPFIGTMMTFADGRIFEGEAYLTPSIEIGQYEQLAIDFVVYDSTTPAPVEISHNGVTTQKLSVNRTVQAYYNRFTEFGTEAMAFKSGDTVYNFNIEVTESSINLAETTDSLAVKLSAAGRKNEEDNPGVWTYEKVTTVFDGFDWSNNGWTGDALKLTNGASACINYQPFATDATANGITIEAELTCSNVNDRNGIVMDCMAEGVGFQMTTEEAKIVASDGSEVETKFAPDIPMKIAFVVNKKSDKRLLELYVNGVFDRAVQYSSTASLIHDVPANIKVTSDAADVELRNVRIYNRALSDDEILANYIVDRQTTDEMVILFQKNDVLNDQTDEIDIDKLLAQGKSVMRIVGDVDKVVETNNKKFEVPVTVYFYSQYGKEYNFVARNVGLRIQGTSSTLYPVKNFRLYFQRIKEYEATLEVNGVLVPDMKYSFKPGARPIDIFCLKADFCDSSSTHNAGAVRIVNDIFKKCGWLTPPQAAYNGEYDVRIGVDSMPINLFYDNDGSGTSTFIGKYNFNNEKSESAIIYGFEDIEGYNDEETLNGERNKCICLEFLNNSEALCLFGTSNMSTFDNALEFRFKPDKTWATADEEDRTAVTRLWTWIQSCKGNPTKFLKEYQDYFINESPFAWYVICNYFMAADNFAKNMMLATWDGIHWMFIPYDMDTLFGLRNDSWLKFKYTVNFDTFDESQGAYCFAGHDSVLWDLVRGCPEKLAEVAQTIRANMSTEYVLSVFNDEIQSAWSERVYNKDSEYKYIRPLTESGKDYLYALQGSRYAHRCYTITNRFNLLDAEYCAGTYRADSFSAYFAYKFASDPRKIKLTASEIYYFGYGYTNGSPTQSALKADDEDSEVTMTIAQDLIINDPQNIYGASRIKTLDLTDVSHALVGTLTLNNCLRMQELDASCASGNTQLTSLILDGCRNLRKLNVSGLNGMTTLNLANCKKLTTLNASKTKLQSVAFASGGKVESASLPGTIQTLELRYLANLKPENLTIADTSNITKLIVDNCQHLDWKQLLADCPNVQYLRATNVDETGNGKLLTNLLTMKGVDEEGTNVSTCRLAGTYRLTRYLSDDEYQELCEHFPELNIIQPEWTVIKFDETVSDSKNVSNLDNETGYDYDNDFEYSGHVAKIKAQRHRVMAKNTATGEMTVCQLSDDDGRVYYDGTEANLEGFNHKTKADEGDVMMYEPNRSCKGIDDFINRCHYDCFSSLVETTPVDGVKLYVADMVETHDKYGCRVASQYTTLAESLTVFDNYIVYVANIGSGFKQVRWPAVNSSVYGAIFLDAEGKIIDRKAASNARMTSDSYLFADIPDGAAQIAFTCERSAEFSFVWLTTSKEIHAIEPDAWNTGEYLCGVNKAYYGNNQMRSIKGVTPTVSTSQSQFAQYCRMRGDGFTLITYPMHRDIARLFFAIYGDRDSSGVCGYGSGSNTTLTGLTSFLGMRDTIRLSTATVGTAGGWYYDDTNTLRNATSINALGYDNLWGNVSEWMEGVISNYLVYNIEEAGETRKVKSASVSDSWIVEVANGRFMDVVPVVVQGTETTNYCDKFWCSNSSARVVQRSSFNAYSYGGVVYAFADYGAAYTNTYYGARLAFNGKIVWAKSVADFLSAEAIG
jgi:hypothetical protein